MQVQDVPACHMQFAHKTGPKGLHLVAGNVEEAAKQVDREELTELQRLRAIIDDITEATNLAPVGCMVINADGAVTDNPLFAGVNFPDKLEAYYHAHLGPNGKLGTCI
jgi:hypothetical protein